MFLAFPKFIIASSIPLGIPFAMFSVKSKPLCSSQRVVRGIFLFIYGSYMWKSAPNLQSVPRTPLKTKGSCKRSSCKIKQVWRKLKVFLSFILNGLFSNTYINAFSRQGGLVCCFCAKSSMVQHGHRYRKGRHGEGPAHCLLITVSTVLHFSLTRCRLSAKQFFFPSCLPN